MKRSLSLLIASSLLSLTAFAEGTDDLTSLESQLNDLKVPANVAPTAVRQEKLYSVQNRYNPLARRVGFSIGAAQNTSGSSFLNSNQINLSLRYHFTNRWSLALGGAYGFNSFTPDANRLMNGEVVPNASYVPDAAYVKYRAHLLPTYNLFYGKFRLSMDRVLYFDQYVSMGPGLIHTQFNTAPAGIADVGLVFWTGKNLDVRIGIQNEFFQEKRLKSSSFERHTLGHVDIGYTFGGTRQTEKL